MTRPTVVGLVLSRHDDAPKISGGADHHAPIAGRSLVDWIIDAMSRSSVRHVAIIDPAAPAAIRANRPDGVSVAVVGRRDRALDAVATDALDTLIPGFALDDNDHVVVLSSDAPQLDATSLRHMIELHLDDAVAATLFQPDTGTTTDLEPDVIQRDGAVVSIDDGTSADGVLIIRGAHLAPAIRRASTTIWQREPRFGDIVRELADAGYAVSVRPAPIDVAPIASARDRARVEADLRDRIVASWLDRGVVIPDPRRITIDAGADIGQGVVLHPGSTIEGDTVIGDAAVIGPNSHLRQASIGAGAVVPHSVVDGADVPSNVVIEPFSVIRTA